ncbi:MAG: YraN family protein [Paludibacteraceae bacterium]|nr:YraN family protein [Paludibacteraceae bacterium]
MAEHNELGNEGEERAVSYLAEKGYKILQRNWRCGQKEIDIVAEKDNMLVIVEVKTRSTDTFEHPKEAITNGKIRNLVTTAEAYIFQHDIMMETRFDVVSVIPLKNGGFKIEHVEDAFLPPVN